MAGRRQRRGVRSRLTRALDRHQRGLQDAAGRQPGPVGRTFRRQRGHPDAAARRPVRVARARELRQRGLQDVAARHPALAVARRGPRGNAGGRRGQLGAERRARGLPEAARRGPRPVDGGCGSQVGFPRRSECGARSRVGGARRRRRRWRRRRRRRACGLRARGRRAPVARPPRRRRARGPAARPRGMREALRIALRELRLRLRLGRLGKRLARWRRPGAPRRAGRPTTDGRSARAWPPGPGSQAPRWSPRASPHRHPRCAACAAARRSARTLASQQSSGCGIKSMLAQGGPNKEAHLAAGRLSTRGHTYRTLSVSNKYPGKAARYRPSISRAA